MLDKGSYPEGVGNLLFSRGMEKIQKILKPQNFVFALCLRKKAKT